MKRKVRNNRGFSLIEIMAAIVLMALLVGSAAVGVNSQIRKGRVKAAESQIGSFASAISSFDLDCGFYPTTLDDLIRNSSGSRCKNFPKEGFLESKGAALKQVPEDPWGNSYNYRRPGTRNPTSYDLWSAGPDGEDGTDDDIGNWEEESSDEG